MIRLSLLSFISVCVASCSGFGGGGKESSPNKLTALTPKVDIRQRWQSSVGSGLGELHRVMPPVISGSQIFANDYKGRVFAFDRDSGRQNWRRDLNITLESGVGVGGGLVILASINGDVIALDEDNGEIQWQTNITNEILAPPQSNGSVVVIQTNDGKLIGLDAKNGKLATEGWSKLSHHDAFDMARRFEDDGVAAIVFTDIARLILQ